MREGITKWRGGAPAATVALGVIALVLMGALTGVALATNSRVSWYDAVPPAGHYPSDNQYLVWTRPNYNGFFGRETRIGPIDILTPADSTLSFPLFHRW